jgi:hypothetical protein
MSYDFSFSKKTISFVLAGFAFVGVMLFLAGLLIGTNWKAEPNAANVAVKQPAAAPPAPQPTDTPQEPVMVSDAAIPGAAVPSEAGASSDAASPVRQAHSNAASVNSKRRQTSPPAPPNDGEVRLIQEAAPTTNIAGQEKLKAVVRPPGSL